MNEFTTEEQQAEQLRQWWRQHGRSVVVGVLLGLTLMFAWNGYNNYQVEQQQQASKAYDLLLAAINNKVDGIEAQGERLKTDHPGNYAALTALQLAALASKKQQWDAAQTQLEWLIQHSDDQAYLSVAHLRLGRLALLELKQIELASKHSQFSPVADYQAQYAELRGDIANAKGDAQSAASEYDQALQELAPGSALRQLIRMKRDQIDV